MTTTTAATAALLVVAGLLVGCKAKLEPQPARPVKTRAVEQLSSNAGVRYSASITPGTQIELAFKVGGYIEAIEQVRGVDGQMRHLQEGDFVRKGTVLARVRQSDYQVKVNEAQSQTAEVQVGLTVAIAQSEQAQQAVQTAKAQAAEAQAAFNRAQLEFDRAKILFASQSITKTDYDAAKAQHDVTEAKVEAAKSQVKTAEAAARVARAQIDAMRAKLRSSGQVVNEAKIPLGDTILRAPMSCTILRRDIEVGSLVPPGRTGFVVADVALVKAMFGVPDRLVASLKLGMPLTLTTEAVSGREFRGQITSISPAADAKSRVFEIEVTVPNADNVLKPGMVVSILAQGGPAPTDTLVVPLNAIVQSKEQPGSYAVFVVETQAGKSVARIRNVKLADTYGNTVAITEGLKSGEQVITTGATLVTDGELVQVIP